MRIPKRYGQSRKNICPFCGSDAVIDNPQRIPVCLKHKQESLDIKCICGSWLDIRTGKFGPYFNCINCGNISFSKGLSMYSCAGADTKNRKKDNIKDLSPKKDPKETTITSDDLDYL